MAEKSLQKRSSLRLDIQGLRALAVIAVIFDHLLHWPGGGFGGVDVFFVISGFLITGILLRTKEQDGRINFVDFYRKRIRRIVPAALVVLLSTVIAGFALFNKSRAVSTLWDSVYAFFFTANWHFAAQGTDYFQATGPASPLQHYWSLSVEEQFYFIWPWMILLVFFVLDRLRRKHTHSRAVLGGVMMVVIVSSFIWAQQETASNRVCPEFGCLLGLMVFRPRLRLSKLSQTRRG